MKPSIRTIVFLCVAMSCGNAFSNSTEYKIKAAYLYQFTKFTQWPERLFFNADTPIQICILGQNPFGSALDSFSSRMSQQRKLAIRYMSSPDNILNCQVIFISQSEEQKLSQILHQVEASPVLTVSDIEDFAQRGGIIGFMYKRNKVGIEINVRASRMAGTKLSSKLLGVATIVHDESPEETP